MNSYFDNLFTKIRTIFNIIIFSIKILKDSNDRNHFFTWIKSFGDNYLIKNKTPWITFNAIDFLDKMDFEGKKVFEYGSGGSTLYWLSRGCSVVSIEHNKNWYERISQLIKGNINIEYYLIEPEPIPDNLTSLDPSDPDEYISSDFSDAKRYFKNYVSFIDKFENEYFDIILIDGRARPACIKHSVNVLKKEGLIILDNSDRNYYLKKTHILLKKFEERTFKGSFAASGWVSETKIFLRHENY